VLLARLQNFRQVRAPAASCGAASALLLAACGLSGGSSASPSAISTPVATAIADSPLQSGGFIALDREGNVYLSSGDGPNPHISKLSPAGQLLTKFVGFTGDSGVQGVAVDSQGNVYGADQGANDVVKFSPAGKVMSTIGASQIGEPGGLAVDSHDALYVADEASAAVEVFSPSGKLTQTIRGTFGKTRGLAVGTLGQLYIVDHEGGHVLTLDSSGKQLASWGEGVNGITLSYPIEVALDSQGDLFVTDPGDMALQKISSDGKLLAKWPARDKYHPIAVAALPDGTTFTTEDADDGKSARVVERSPAGRELAMWR